MWSVRRRRWAPDRSRVVTAGIAIAAVYSSSCAVTSGPASLRFARSAGSGEATLRNVGANGGQPLRGPLDVVDPPISTPERLSRRASGGFALNPAADMVRAEMLAEGAEGSGDVALTFDDGPALETTPEVLRLLAAHGLKGAFFLTGSRLEGRGEIAQVNREIARAIVAEGHLVGNHGLEHQVLLRASPSWTDSQIARSAALIAEATSVYPRHFRPPYGRLGEVGRTIIADRGDELVTWTIGGGDSHERDPERLAHRLIGQLKFAGQGVVLLHDLKRATVRALGILLDWLESNPRDSATGTGYTVVDLPAYLARAAARPFPHKNRLELFYARERFHAGGAIAVAVGRSPLTH